jgi:hypothetical protein
MYFLKTTKTIYTSSIFFENFSSPRYIIWQLWISRLCCYCDMTPESRNSGPRVDFVLDDLELRESLETPVEDDRRNGNESVES